MTTTTPATTPTRKRPGKRGGKRGGRKPATAPVPMPSAEWRAAILTSALPRQVKITACQLAHFCLTPADCLVREPSPAVLGDCAELPARAVLNALTLLASLGWTTQVADPDDPSGERSLTCLTDPRDGSP